MRLIANKKLTLDFAHGIEALHGDDAAVGGGVCCS